MTGIDLAEELEMEHLFIRSGKILSSWACFVACLALGMGGVMVKVGTDG